MLSYFLWEIAIHSGEFSHQAANLGRMTAPVTRSGEMIERVADGGAAPIAARLQDLIASAQG
jgi:hypothetical protein